MVSNVLAITACSVCLNGRQEQNKPYGLHLFVTAPAPLAQLLTDAV